MSLGDTKSTAEVLRSREIERAVRVGQLGYGQEGNLEVMRVCVRACVRAGVLDASHSPAGCKRLIADAGVIHHPMLRRVQAPVRTDLRAPAKQEQRGAGWAGLQVVPAVVVALLFARIAAGVRPGPATVQLRLQPGRRSEDQSEAAKVAVSSTARRLFGAIALVIVHHPKIQVLVL